MQPRYVPDTCAFGLPVDVDGGCSKRGLWRLIERLPEARVLFARDRQLGHRNQGRESEGGHYLWGARKRYVREMLGSSPRGASLLLCFATCDEGDESRPLRSICSKSDHAASDPIPRVVGQCAVGLQGKPSEVAPSQVLRFLA